MTLSRGSVRGCKKANANLQFHGCLSMCRCLSTKPPDNHFSRGNQPSIIVKHHVISNGESQLARHQLIETFHILPPLANEDKWLKSRRPQG